MCFWSFWLSFGCPSPKLWFLSSFSANPKIWWLDPDIIFFFNLNGVILSKHIKFCLWCLMSLPFQKLQIDLENPWFLGLVPPFSQFFPGKAKPLLSSTARLAMVSWDATAPPPRSSPVRFGDVHSSGLLIPPDGIPNCFWNWKSMRSQFSLEILFCVCLVNWSRGCIETRSSEVGTSWVLSHSYDQTSTVPQSLQKVSGFESAVFVHRTPSHDTLIGESKYPKSVHAIDLW